ncbi:presenilin-like protein At2g29900 [Lolium perenne]|uniref:presenilin-like protein At2g29900 n=1 Tax=Lolium perenne TaxID=4522 RepID=UPI0021E9EF21|nr:presenilin-like protein At2g29900 [Lolium perenne]
MADGGPAPAVDVPVPVPGGGAPATILDSLGEDITRIVGPVSACMLIVVLLVSILSSPSSPSPLTAALNTAAAAGGDAGAGDDLTSALITAGTFVVFVTAATFLMALLFYFRCTPCLRAYMGFSAIWVLLALGGQICLLLLSRLRLPLDAVSFALLLPNAVAALALAAVSPASVPIALHQSALLAIAVLTAFWFTLLPEWTTWALLLAMAVYDLGAVLIPGGPLRVLLELAMERNEEIPALIYEARPVDPRHGQNWRLWASRQPPAGDLDPTSTADAIAEALRRRSNSADSLTQAAVGNPSLSQFLVPALSSDPANAQTREVLAALPETRVDVAALRVPLIQPQPDRTREQQDDDSDDEGGIGLGSSGAIKLGLGDFIFYSVLVGRAAMYDYMTVYACYLAIIAGLGVTLLLLAFFRKALPALPVSITLGVLFYVLTRTLLENFVMQCSTNFLMF